MERQTSISKRILSIMLKLIIVLALLYLPGGIFGNTDFGLTVHAATTGVTFKAVDGKPSGFAGEGYANLFDNKTSTKWCCNYASGSTYVVIKASEPIAASGYTISTGNDTGSNPGRNPKAWTLSACNNYNEKTKTSENWTVIDKVTEGGLPTANQKSKSFTLTETPEMYRYFKLDITSIVSGTLLQISEFSFTYTTCDHQWGDFGEKVDPECLNYGYTPQFCTLCGYAKETDIVDALGHNFENRLCTRCGAKDTDLTEPSLKNGVYQIGTPGELYWFAGLVNGTLDGVIQNTSAKAELTADITVNEAVFDENGNLNEGLVKWTPIGSQSSPYNGIFDGYNHTIGGLYCNNTDRMYVGLFGLLSEGAIENVGVVDSYIRGFRCVGGVCGYIEKNGTIGNCYNTGTVIGVSNVGGICGFNELSRLLDCYNTGDITGSTKGIATEITVAKEDYVGGVCGNCYNGIILDSYNTGGVQGNGYVGGVCGQMGATNRIENCYNTGKVCGNESVGGFSGGLSTKIITNCYYLEGCNEEGTNFTVNTGTSKTLEQFRSGEVAFLLQKARTDVVWGQNIDNDEPAEPYPVLGGAKVYKAPMYVKCVDNPENPTGHIYSNKETVYVDHDVTQIEAEAPTCTADGNIEYYMCSFCKNLFSDAVGSAEITANDVVVKATGHDYEWIVDEEATETESGSRHEECRNCHDKKTTVEIPPTATVQSEDEIIAAIDNSFTSIKLDQDITLLSTLDLSGKNITLDLNGHVISGAKILIITNQGPASLTLIDSNPTATHTDSTLPLGGVVSSDISMKREAEVNKEFVFYANGGTVTSKFYSNTDNASVKCTCNMPTAFTGNISGYLNLYAGIYYGTIADDVGIQGKKVTFQCGDKVYAYEIVSSENNVISPAAPPVKEGYDTFDGWYDDETAYTFGSALSKNITLTAKFRNPINYQIACDLGGGEAANPNSYTVENDAITLNNPVRTGYTFTGWSGTGLTGEDNMAVTVPAGSTGDRTYTAHYSEKGGYTVAFDTCGGSEISSKTNVKWTDKVLDSISAPTKNGYRMAGWKCGNAVVTADTTYGDLVAEDTTTSVTLVAQWEDITAPTGTIGIGTDKWTQFHNDIHFDLFFANAQTVTITASDNNGDAVSIEYLLSSKELTEAELAKATFTAYNNAFGISPDHEYVIYAKLTDSGNNVTYINSDGIVLDATAPVISGVENGKAYSSAKTVTVTEKYLASVTVNGKPVTLNNNNQFTLSEANGEQTIVATDQAGNRSANMIVTVNTKMSPEKEQSISSVTNTITKANTDKGDVKGSSFAPLKLKATSAKNKTVKLSWSKVRGAKGYIVYGAMCGKNLKKVKTTKGLSYTIKNLKAGKYYKYMVVAYKTVQGKQVTASISKVVHTAVQGGKYGNATKITVKKINPIKRGKKITLKATVKNSSKKVKTHVKLRYESTNTKIATVSSKGVITAKKKGVCYIYVYAQNGIYKQVKVTVK